MTTKQYIAARIYFVFRHMTADPKQPPTLAECLLYEACFAYQILQEK